MTDDVRAPRPGNPLAVTGFVVAVIALLFCLVFGPGIIGLVVAAGAATLSWFGYRRARRGAAHVALAIAGGALGGVLALVCAVVSIVVAGLIGANP